MRKIIDIHQHVSTREYVEKLAAEYNRLGVARAVLLGMPPARRPGDNELVLQAQRAYPDLFIPFFGFDLDSMNPGDLKAAAEHGYRGVKFIGPRLAYNDQAYLPVYEEAARLRLPALFHLGIIANSPAWRDVDSGLMRPVHLEYIARRIPELTVIGAHLGNPWSDEAAMACRWNANLFFDLSGSLLKYRTPEYLGGLLWWKKDGPYRSPDNTSPWQKILFGSDVDPESVEEVIGDYERLFQALDLAPESREDVWYRNAARLLNLPV